MPRLLMWTEAPESSSQKYSAMVQEFAFMWQTCIRSPAPHMVSQAWPRAIFEHKARSEPWAPLLWSPETHKTQKIRGWYPQGKPAPLVGCSNSVRQILFTKSYFLKTLYHFSWTKTILSRRHKKMIQPLKTIDLFYVHVGDAQEKPLNSTILEKHSECYWFNSPQLSKQTYILTCK